MGELSELPETASIRERAQASEIERTDRTALYLKEAQTLRRIAAVLTLRSARATVLQAAIEYEQLAAALGPKH